MSKLTDSLSYSHLLKILDYNSETGIFRWKIDIGRGRSGTEAGTFRNIDGARHIRINGKFILSHRLAWFYVFGEWPIWPKHIDHINGNRVDNRIANLRIALPAQNRANSKRRVDNTSGFKGVSDSWGKSRIKRWRAMIVVRQEGRRKQITIGRFKTREEAHAAYLVAAKQHFGEFARGE